MAPINIAGLDIPTNATNVVFKTHDATMDWYKDPFIMGGFALMLLGLGILASPKYKGSAASPFSRRFRKDKALGQFPFLMVIVGADLAALGFAQRNFYAFMVGYFFVLLGLATMAHLLRLIKPYPPIGKGAALPNGWRIDEDNPSVAVCDATADDAYADLAKPLLQVIVVFIVQSMLLVYFFVGMCTAEKRVVSWRSYIPGVFVQLCMSAATGADPHSTMKNMYIATRFKTAKMDTFKDVGWVHQHARKVLSSLANYVALGFIMGLVPLMLMNLDAMDFVKDSFAVIFIVTLDDYSTPVETTYQCDITESDDEEETDDEGASIL